MNKFSLLLIALCFASGLKADSLDLIFRYYKGNGKIENAPLTLILPNGTSTALSSPDAAGWQHWQIQSETHPYELTIVDGSDTSLLVIDVLNKYRGTVLKSLVINRLQYRKKKQTLKVNQLTCRWTGSIAYPIEYAFCNPLDGETLKLDRLRCATVYDSLKLELHFLSDSVMLYKCGKKEALFFKYFLGSDGKFYHEASAYTCTEFSNQEEQKFYLLLANAQNSIAYDFDGKKLILKDLFCYWEFLFD